jgi:hypothetical protein
LTGACPPSNCGCTRDRTQAEVEGGVLAENMAQSVSRRSSRMTDLMEDGADRGHGVGGADAWL